MDDAQRLEANKTEMHQHLEHRADIPARRSMRGCTFLPRGRSCLLYTSDAADE